jgi:hypothetical protein
LSRDRQSDFLQVFLAVSRVPTVVPELYLNCLC